MAQGLGTSSSTSDTIAVSVHGPTGVLDLVVPLAATSVDVARAYASEVGLSAIPLLQTPTGKLISAGTSLGELGFSSGALLIASTGVHRPRQSRLLDNLRNLPDTPQLATMLAALAVGAASLAAWFAARSGEDTGRTTVVAVLLGCALVGALPWGRHAAQRAAAAPAFGAAAGFAAYYEPGAHLLPTIVAVSALSAAVIAAIGRAASPKVTESATVWIAAGSTVAVVCALSPMLEWPATAVWAILLVLAMLGARFVPSLAIDVPDEALLDLERLAVTAWSARDTGGGRGKRGRIVVAAAAMEHLVASASRTVTAGAVAIAVVTVVASPMMLSSATLDLDRIGARCLVFFVGASLLLAARSYRHVSAQFFLRMAGLAAWAVLGVHLLGTDVMPGFGWVVAVAVLLGLVVGLVAVAVGRGWRSVWWARRAEVAESMAGAFGLAAAVVASGIFRILWEITS